jgi:hypothetical protein
MHPEQETLYNHIIYTIHLAGGRVISPDQKMPILFEAAVSSHLPRVLSKYGSVANMGQAEAASGSPPHGGDSNASLFRFDPPRISVPQD